MNARIKRTLSIVSLAATILTIPMQAKDPSAGGVPVTVTVTAAAESGKRMPAIEKEDVLVKKGADRIPVSNWVAAQGENAGLELFILIDDASTTSLGLHLDELRAFINAQPATTQIGVGYTRNASIDIVQNFTDDHALAAKALRLPLGTAGAFGSPYLSVADLMKRWSETPNRREIILITDGADRAHRGNFANPDVDTAATVAQRTGTMIHSIYFPGVSNGYYRNFREWLYAQNNLARLSEASGGEFLYLGRQAPVSLTTYLNELQNVFDNQYRLTFSIAPGKKAGLKAVRVDTELAGVQFTAPGAVWVPPSN